MQNTELRLKVLDLGYPIVEVSTAYGFKKKGKRLELKYLVQAPCSFVRIAMKR